MPHLTSRKALLPALCSPPSILAHLLVTLTVVVDRVPGTSPAGSRACLTHRQAGTTESLPTASDPRPSPVVLCVLAASQACLVPEEEPPCVEALRLWVAPHCPRGFPCTGWEHVLGDAPVF